MRRINIDLVFIVLCYLLVFFTVKSKASVEEILRDANKDGFPEQKIFISNNEVIKAEIDLDRDGKPERYEFFKNGIISKIEYDRDHNKVPEKIVFFKDGRPVKIVNHINQVTESLFLDQKGRCIRKEIDKNSNGKAEEILVFQKEILVKKFIDQDENSVFEKKYFYKNGKILRQELDLNQDQKPDEIFYYKKGLLIKEDKDKNFDGKFEEVYLYKHGKLSCVLEDLDRDGFFEQKTFYDKDGDPIKVFLDIDHSGKPEVIYLLYKNKKEIIFDKDEDGFPEKKELYQYGKLKKIVYLNKGKIFRQEFYKNQRLFRLEVDKNNDGFFERIAFYKKGHLSKLRILDPSKNSLEIHFFDLKGNLVKLIQKNTKKTIIWHYNKNKPIYFEEYTNGNRVAEMKIFYYKHDKKELIRDINGDGKPDIWEIFHGQKLAIIKRDLDGDGIPDLTEEVPN